MLPELLPLPPALRHDRLRVERHARELRSIVMWALLAQARNALRRLSCRRKPSRILRMPSR